MKLKVVLLSTIIAVFTLCVGKNIVIAQNYGNEWINFSQSYFKFKIAENGVYRISQSLLQSNGFGNVPGNQFAIYREGVQVPIYVSTNNVLGTSDYIEFYGRKADGKMDTEMYALADDQGNDKVSIINDSATYFITFSNSINNRLVLNGNTPPSILPTAEPFCITTVYPQENIRSGFSNGNSEYKTTQYSYTYHAADFDRGEGMSYSATTNLNLNFLVPGIFAEANPSLATSVLYFGKQNAQPVTYFINNNEMNATTLNAFQMVKSNVPFNKSFLTANTLLRIRMTSTVTSATNMIKGLKAEITYNRTFDFTNVTDLDFQVQGNNQIQLLTLNNIGSGENRVVDITTGNLYNLSSNNVFLTPTSQMRSLFFANNVKNINNLIPVNFRNYNLSINQGDYLILSDNEYIDIPNGGVTQFKNYRNSSVGGNYNVVVVSANELYEQFGYGVDYHPLGIKRFLRFAQVNSNWVVKPEHMFIIGKGISYNNIYYYQQNRATLNYPIVPTYGTPGSDFMLAESPDPQRSSTPILAVGRLSVINNQEIVDYLEKVKKYEVAISTPSVPNLENSLWKKRSLHIAGSRSSQEQASFFVALNNVKDIIEDTLTGSIVTTVGKTTSSVIENATAQVDSLISVGVQMINFFGHASSSGFDYNLNSPEKIHSSPHFPVFFAYGCDVARIFEPTNNKTISENYLDEPDGGSIAMLACTNIGWTGSLTIYMQNLARKIAQDQYGKTLGQQLMKNIADLQYNNNNIYTSIHSQNLLLQGDPALKIYNPDKTDYYIDQSLVSTNPGVVNSTIDSFEINATLYNLGKAVNDDIWVRLIKTKAGSSNILFSDSVKIKLLNTRNVSFKIPVDPNNDVGLFNYTISINDEQTPDEITFVNNKVTIQLYISEDNLKPIYPYDFSIVTNPNIELKASTLNPFIKPSRFLFEVDTTELFNSPLKQTHSVISGGGLIKWKFPMSMVDSTVYYWRTTYDTVINGSHSWNNSSFIYLKDGSEGWNQSHYYQYKNDQFYLLDINEPDRDFKGVNYFRDIRVQCRDYAYGGENDIFLNSVLQGFGACALHNGILFMIFEPKYGVPVSYTRNQFPGSFSTCEPAKARQIEFNIATSAGRKNAMDYIDSIKDNYYVLVKASNRATINTFSTVDDWKNDSLLFGSGNTLYHKLLDLGLDFDPLTERKPYIGFTKKGDPNYTSSLIFGPNESSLISLDVNMDLTAPSGEMSSVVVGPSSEWKQLLWKLSEPINDTGNDKSYVSVYGLRNSDDVNGDSLFTTSNIDTSLIDINASVYPFLKLKWYAEDSSKLTLPQLKYWRVMHQPLPEAALNPNALFSFKDSLNQGEKLNLKMAIENVRELPMDSMLVRFRLVDASNVSRIVKEARYKPMGANDTINVDITDMATEQYVGKNMIFVEANPDDDQPEHYHPNNLGYIPFYVKADAYAPVLDVTFDGIHILNKDIISPRPLINILVRDENLNFLINDTSSISVHLISHQNNAEVLIPFDGTICKFIPATPGTEKNEARVEYRPMLEDGVYTLRVDAKDKVGNVTGGKVPQKYEISFEVINKSTITNVLNYPNPFSTSTQFLFTLTGSEIPSQFKIQIISVTGKVVKEITKAELGNIHIGRNITEYKWDGKDQFGQTLGNGVYLYRVITTNREGESVERRQNTTVDKYFKNDYGKLYIMR